VTASGAQMRTVRASNHFRQLVGEFRRGQAVVASEDDDRAVRFRHQAALGGEKPEVEGGAGSLQGAAGGHRP